MNEQLSLFEGVSDAERVSLTENVSDTKMAAIQRFLGSASKETEVSVNSYSPGGRKKKYYRLSYRLNRKSVKHIHIPGGNINSELANYRADKLRVMIARGAELGEVIAAVKTYQL